jgi:hypothetical protein
MKMSTAQQTQAHATATTPCPLMKNDWVGEKDVQHPSIGQVKACYWDRASEEWVMDIVLYSPDGERIGRESPAMGGPTGFEPAVPFQTWSRIAEPNFPLRRDSSGYRDWKEAFELLEARTDMSAGN